jgi:hypothetical protein
MNHPVSKLTRRSVLAAASATLAASTFPFVGQAGSTSSKAAIMENPTTKYPQSPTSMAP